MSLTLEPTTPSRDTRAQEFERLTRGLKTPHLAEVMKVSRQMVFKYRRVGAPADRLALLRDYVASRARELEKSL